MPTTRSWAAAAVTSAVLFVLLLILVALHATEHLDDAVRNRVTPVGVWSPGRQRMGQFVYHLGPRTMVLLLVGMGGFLAIRRRSSTPLLIVGGLLLLVALPVLAGKYGVSRADTTGSFSAGRGSFPSGHMALAVICAGGAVMTVLRRPRWWHWLLVSAFPAVMGVALVVASIHWVSDIAGGALVGVWALSVVGLLLSRHGTSDAAGDPGGRTAPAAPRGTSAAPSDGNPRMRRRRS